MLKNIDAFTSMVDGVTQAFTTMETNLTAALTPSSASSLPGGLDG